MKKIKLVLCLVLFVCGVEQAFGQNAVVDRFKADINKVLLTSYSTDSIDIKVDYYCWAYKWDAFDMNSSQKEYWKECANRVFQKSKKELEKLDAKTAKGKAISTEDANKAAILYSLGYAPICAQNYQKAADYYNKIGDNATLPTKFAGNCCLYKINGDKTPAISLLESIDLKELEQNNYKQIAAMYGLEEDFNTVLKKKIAEFVTTNKQTIKRAIRSKNWDLLESYSDYGIREVDSLLCVEGRHGKWRGDEEAVQKYWKKCREDGYIFGYTQNRETLMEYISTAKDVFPIFEYDITRPLIAEVDYGGFYEAGKGECEILIKAIKNDPYAGLIVGAAQCAKIFHFVFEKEEFARNTNKIIQILVKKIPEILTWKDCPLLIKADGTFQVKESLEQYYLDKFGHGINDANDMMTAVVQPVINYCKAHRNKK